MKRGLFITVEGTDGSGKTTQMGFISEYLKNAGYDVVLTREPGGTRISEKIRSIILEPDHTEMGSITELLLYSAARAQLVHEVIRPSLEKGIMVVCDRYVDSTYAYQGYGRGLDSGLLEDISDIAVGGLMPDVTLFFDLDPETALKRRLAATQSDRIENEQLEFHKRVHCGYERLAEKYPERIKRIDADRTAGCIWAEVRIIMDAILKQAYTQYI
jgi:dTMP kinase